LFAAEQDLSIASLVFIRAVYDVFEEDLITTPSM
jgi:hypothetical protein